MSNHKRPILVFGATGQQGGSVAKALLNAQWPVRAVVRDTTTSNAKALHKTGVELVQGSFGDADIIQTAMKDAYGVFSVLPGNLAEGEEVRLGCMIADLTAETGIEHLVYSSGASVGETLTGIARFDAKPRIETHVRKLPVTATIIRPMIFMEMLVKPGLGLDEDRYTFFLKPDQSMQLVAVEDIGKFVAEIFADKPRFAGKTTKLASDTVTGHELEAIFSKAVGRPIAYSRFSEALLAANSDLAHIASSLDHGPLSEHVDMNLMRDIHPNIISFRSWLAGTGQSALNLALAKS